MANIITLKSFPFDSMEVLNSQSGKMEPDRLYEAEIFRKYFAKFLSNGVYFGNYKNYGENSMKVIADGGLNIKVSKGAGIIEGADYENEEEKLNELLHFLSAKKYSEMPDKQNRVLDYGALKINAEYRSVESNGELVQLTNYEFEILYLLAKNPGRIFSKEQIYTQVWKEPYYGAEDNVMGIIRRIRKKIEPDSAKPRYILNVWGMGYKFNGELMK